MRECLINKALLTYFLLLFSSTFTIASYLAPSDSFRYEGTIKNGEKVVPGMIINVYLNDNKILSKTTNRQGNFFIYLQHNKSYILEFIKKNYIIEKIVIDTKVSDNTLKGGGIEIAQDNTIPVFENFESVKTDIFVEPVIYYVFNANTNFFDEDKKRSKTAKLTAIATKINSARTKAANDELKIADNLYKKKAYTEALISYKKVLELNPSNAQATAKYEEVNKELKKAGQIEKEYKNTITKANSLFASKSYADSREEYVKAHSLKPEDVYASNQIYVVDSIISKNYSENKKAYDLLKASADKDYKDKNYEKAIEGYKSSLKLLPDEVYPKNQIKSINATLDAEKKKKTEEAKALDAKFNDLMTKAAGYSAKKDYANAIAMYKQALQVKPDDANAKDLKNKAEDQLTQLAIEKRKKMKEKNYNDTIALADNALSKKNYENAKMLYAAAGNIKPDEKYPAKKLNEIDKLLKQSEKKNLDSENRGSEKVEESESKITDNKPNSYIESAIELEKKGNKLEATKAYSSAAIVLQDSAYLGKALVVLDKALKLVKTTGDKNTEAQIKSQIASVYYDSGIYKLTVKNYNEAIELKKQLKDEKGASQLLSDLGGTLTNIYQYDNALDAYEQALKIEEKTGNKEDATETCNQIANIYYNQSNYKKSIEFYTKALDASKTINDKKIAGNLLNSLGVVYYKMGNYDNALNYFNKSIDNDKQTGNKKNMSLTYNNMGNVNFDWNKYETAIEYYQKSLLIKKELNFEEGIAVSLLNIGNAYMQLKNIPKAIEFLNSSLDLSKRIKFREVMRQAYKGLSKVYEAKNDFKSAVDNYKGYASIGGPASVDEGQFVEFGNQYERESKTIKRLKKELYKQKILADNEALLNKQKEQQLAIKNMELKNQKLKVLRTNILLIFSILCILLAGLFALQYYNRYKERKLYGEVITFQKQQITDSIEYASRIQKAVLPPIELVKSIFPESFIFNRPKDIVSGDYFYVAVLDGKTYVAVADCTGHGVPGAFMSMLGISLIKEVIMLDEKAPSANQVLNQLRDSLMKALHQTGKEDEAKDGMDIALCIIDPKNNTLEYSGANNPCYVIREEKIIDLKADRMPIGIHPVLKPFTSQKIDLQNNDVIYLFSDGYRDQIGSETLKKYKKEHFNNLLLKIHKLPIEEQYAKMEVEHINWRGDIEQTDDIMVMGIKISM